MLSQFYKDAAGGAVSLLSLDIQTEMFERNGRQSNSTEAKDIPDAGFSDAYVGDQGSATGIMALLELIRDDFDTTVKDTEQAEKEAEQEWLEMQTEMGKSNATKTATWKSVQGQLVHANAEDQEARSTMQHQQTLMDKALGQLEALRGPCLGFSGMTAEEQKTKREEEINAL